ncbi:MAG: HAD-IA family hydrolase [Patescibacteria group bacterium]|nr:HAD-IA family hydrolase [Patescibacteria group bacterium]
MFDSAIEVLIFDSDGVLVKTENNNSVNYPTKLFVDLVSADRTINFPPWNGTDWISMLQKAGFDIHDPEKLKIASERMSLWDNGKNKRFGWVEEIIPVLSTKFKLALLTNNSRANIAKYLGCQIDCFSAVRTYENLVGELKPSPVGILEICEELNIHPSKAIMIGDSEEDLIAASKAGANSIIISWNNPSQWFTTLKKIFESDLLPRNILNIFTKPKQFIDFFQL